MAKRILTVAAVDLVGAAALLPFRDRVGECSVGECWPRRAVFELLCALEQRMAAFLAYVHSLYRSVSKSCRNVACNARLRTFSK